MQEETTTEEVAKVLDVSEETIESLGEGVEVLDEELDHIQRDYHSQTKRESRSFAFDRRLVKTRGSNGKPAGITTSPSGFSEYVISHLALAIFIRLPRIPK